jgi:predicted adenine nucleotide alpha hydrolase (AANH) superfamily ATPase
MRILLHVCCGPCALYPLHQLRAIGHEVTGFFHNPNIHPYHEFRRRLEAVRQFAQETGCPVEIDEHYGLTEYLRQVVFHEQERCPRCYEMRLARTAETAVAGNFDAFTTTLLYSKYQNHRLLIDRCEQLASRFGIGLYYEDFRLGWQQGIDESIRMGLYRQPYCGCIYSEQERYDKQLRKQTAR